MLTKTIEYTDFLGNKQTGTVYFNLTRAELVRWMMVDEGLVSRLEGAQSMSGAEIIEEFDGLIKKSFGRRSDDGKRFVKSDEIYNDFVQTALYDEFFTKLVTDPSAAQDFVNGIMPADLINAAKKDLEMQQNAGLTPNDSPRNTPTPPEGGASGI